MTNSMMFDRSVMLENHLRYNFVPPIHYSFFSAVEEAIDACNEGNWNKKITLPNDKILTAGTIAEELHLDCFIDQDVLDEENW